MSLIHCYNYCVREQVSMKIEEQHPSEYDIQQILKESGKREVVVKSLLQALSSLGYAQTVKALEKESMVKLEKERVSTIEGLLKSREYKAASEEVKLIDIVQSIKTEVLEMLEELKLVHLLSLGKIEEALEELGASKLSQEKKLEFYKMIALDNARTDEEYFLDKHRQIIFKFKNSITDKGNVKQFLDSYLSNGSIAQYNRISQPPKALIAQNQGSLYINGRVSFIKFNKKGNELILVSQSSREYELSHWKIKDQLIVKHDAFRNQSIGCITSAKWSSQETSMNSQLIGLCSYECFSVFKTSKLSIIFTVKRTQLEVNKFLCFGWHPISEVIYIGGLYHKLIGLDSSGEMITEVNPFKSTREIVFSPKGQLFAISAVDEGHLLKYCLAQQKIEKEFKASSLFMDLKYSDERVIVTNKDFVYVLDSKTLLPIYTIDSPINEKMYKIQAFLCGPWLITYNQQLRGTLKIDRLLRQVKWQNCDAVDVSGKRMVSCKSSIKLWEESNPNLQQVQSEEVESSMQNGQANNSSLSECSSSSQQLQSAEEGGEMMEIEYLNNESYEDHFS